MIVLLLLSLQQPSVPVPPQPSRDAGGGRCGTGMVVGSFFPTIDLQGADGAVAASLPVPKTHKLPAPLPVLRCGNTMALVEWQGKPLAVSRARVTFDQPARVVDCGPPAGAAVARETSGNAAAMGMGGRVKCPGPGK